MKVWTDADGCFHQAVHDLAGVVAAAGTNADLPGPPGVDLAICEPEDADTGFDPPCAV